MNARRLRELRNLFVLGVVSGMVFFFFLDSRPFYDRGEPREALVVRDIFLNGNWLFPLKLENQIPSKPPLFHWLGALASIARGEMTEATVRFPSALFASLGVFLIYYLGKRLYDSDVGLWAGLILATTGVYYSLGSEARVDMALTFAVALPLTLFYFIYSGIVRHDVWWYLFFLVTGAGVTAKGPVSVVLCALVITLFLVTKKRADLFLRFARHPGMILGIVACLSWYGAALYMGGEQFFGLQFLKENLARFFVHGEGGTGHQKPLYYFIPYFFTLGLPWTIFLPIVIWRFCEKRTLVDDRLLFLGIWVAVVLVFFSLSAGKRPPYILPLYPPLALLIAASLCSYQAKVPAWIPRSVSSLAMGVGLMIAALFSGYLISDDLFWLLKLWPFPLEEDAASELAAVREALNQRIWLISAILPATAVLWVLSGWDVLHGTMRRSAIHVTLLALLGIVIVQGVVNPGLASTRSYKEFMQKSKQTALGQGMLMIFPKGVDVTSIVFYGGRNVKLLPGNYEALRSQLRRSKEYVVMAEVEWKEFMSNAHPPVPVIIRDRGSGPDGNGPLVLIRGGAAE
ncbi:MAG TPA: glycosyltransferase family 39 protein [Candidatus Binatia bacterium]|nr:glycosyltransferase family 39 protein [Candidatus Binatia bacterium]